MKKLSCLLIVSSLLLGACTAVPKKAPVPPSVSTARVVESLSNTKSELQQAGDANTKVGLKIDKALSLAERLKVLLAQIEADQASSNKNVIKPVTK